MGRQYYKDVTSIQNNLQIQYCDYQNLNSFIWKISSKKILMESHGKDLLKPNDLERETRVGSLTLLEFKFHHKVTVIQTLWYKYIDKYTNQKKGASRNKSSHIWSNGFWQAKTKIMQIRETLSFQKNGAGKKLDIHIQEKGIEPWSYIIHKNQLKMDQTPKCKNYKIS